MTKYHSRKVQLDGKAFVSDELVQEAMSAYGLTENEAVTFMIKEQLEAKFPTDDLLKLNEVLFIDELKDPDVYLHQK